jgi:hypothetical protein
MLAPVIVQIAFWLGVVGSIAVGTYLLRQGFEMPTETPAERKTASYLGGGAAAMRLGSILSCAYDLESNQTIPPA